VALFEPIGTAEPETVRQDLNSHVPLKAGEVHRDIIVDIERQPKQGIAGETGDSSRCLPDTPRCLPRG